MAKNYLSNKDMLREIYLSKNSYCSYSSPEHQQYDYIVTSTEDIPASIPAAREARAERLKKEGQEVEPGAIADTDLVFRVMTWEHVPPAPAKPAKPVKSTSKVKKLLPEFDTDLIDENTDEDPSLIMTPADPARVKVNFPPFQHYMIGADGQLHCVAKSHWKGSLREGEFCKTHGAMTDILAMMFIKLCERYASRYNWRGYTYNDEMRGSALLQLSQVGLQFDESKSNNPFGYFSQICTNSFTRILNIEKKNQAIRDDILESHGLTPSFSRQMSWHKESQL